MALAHYQKAVLLLIRKHTTLVSAQHLGRKLFGFKRSEVRELCASCCTIDPVIYLEQLKSGGWVMHAPDRVQPITDDFLAGCEPSWAQEIRTAMAQHAATTKSGEEELREAVSDLLALLGTCVRKLGKPCGGCPVCRARALVIERGAQ